MTDVARIECTVTFLATSEGGRQTMPKLSGNFYRPHIVVGDPEQRSASFEKRDVKLVDGDGKAFIRRMDVVAEDYLSVMFEVGPDEARFREECNVVLILMYFPYEGYSKLGPDVTFTIREGAKIVGFGEVKRWLSRPTD